MTGADSLVSIILACQAKDCKYSSCLRTPAMLGSYALLIHTVLHEGREATSVVCRDFGAREKNSRAIKIVHSPTPASLIAVVPL